MATKGVEILSVTKISPPPLPETPPPMKLSLFDAVMIGHAPVQRLLLYPNPTTTNHLPFPSLLELLKSSLSATLLDYLPLAGKLTYVTSTGDVEIDFSDPNVAFVVAESDLDLHRLAASEIHEVGSFDKLVPALDFSVLPFRVFAVQVTRFKCGGVAVGYTVHHAIADGKALFHFVEAWSGTCKAMAGDTESPIDCRGPITYDRAVIKHPKGEEIARQFLHDLAPGLPMMGRLLRPPEEEECRRLARRTFILDPPSIQSLKRRAARRHDTSNSTTSRLPSAFSAISAHVWACIARSKSFVPDEPTALIIPMDCRARLDPQIDQDYFGNCIRPVIAAISAGELTGEDGLTNACTAIRESIDDVPKVLLSDCEGWIANAVAKLNERCVIVSGSPRFRAYDADFGWGRPGRFELVSLNRDGQFVLYAGTEEGTVQASVTLESNQMQTFAGFFLDGLRGSYLHISTEKTDRADHNNYL